MMLVVCFLIASFVSINCQSSTYNCGNKTSYNGTSGMIYSPNYPGSYRTDSNCTYTWNVPTLSSMSLTFQYIDVEDHSRCLFDYVALSCRSHSVALSSRYCGSGSNLSSVTFSPCTQVLVWFISDESVVKGGFRINYRANPIECARNCSLLSNAYGYICSCSPNGTNVTMPTPVPNLRCLTGCSLSLSSMYCICRVFDLTPTTTTATTTTTTDCMPPCSLAYDFYGDSTCTCTQTTTTPSPIVCPSRCNLTTDLYENQYCSCPPSTLSPLTCPSGCQLDSGFGGHPVCTCQGTTQPTTTQPPMWCSSGCFSDIDAYGARYCRCPTTTLPPCYSPCYYSWDYTYDYLGRRYCYCPPTTTTPPPTGCNQTLTASYGTVTSPNYPNAYTRGIDCYQYISVPMATTITIRVLDINIYYSSSYSCEYDYVEIIGCDESITQFCVSYTFPTSGLVLQCADHSPVTIRFHSYGPYTYYYDYRGFKLSYSAGFASNCSESGHYLVQGSTGVVTSPNYPNNFPGYSECANYLFTDDENIKIKITFAQLRLESSPTCTNVFIQLTCEEGGEYTRTVCGSRIPGPVTIECRNLQILFRSNATTSFSPRNYKLIFYAVAKNPSATAPWRPSDPQPSLAGESRSYDNDLSQSAKTGIGLGVGVGGFFLIILIVIIIVLVVGNQRQAARRDRRHLEELAVVCRNMNAGSGSVPMDSVNFWRGAQDAGFARPTEAHYSNANPMAVGRLPSYSNEGYIGPGNEGYYAGPESQAVGGPIAEEPKVKLVE